jgi:heparin binding hemagglutinin HbhA
MTRRTGLTEAAAESKPLLAAVGATDVAVERVREILGSGRIQDCLQRVPAAALSHALGVASRAESGYEDLADRGRERIDHLRTGEPGKQVIARGLETLERTQAVVAEGRRGVEGVLSVMRQRVGGISRTTSTPEKPQAASAPTSSRQTPTTTATKPPVSRTTTRTTTRTASRSAAPRAATRSRAATPKPVVKSTPVVRPSTGTTTPKGPASGKTKS